MPRFLQRPLQPPGLLLLASALLLSQPGLAAEWAVEPEIRTSASYDDNFRLRIEEEDAVWEGAVEPKVTFARRTERAEIAGSGAVNVRRFDDSDLDTEDVKLDLKSFYTLQRSRLGLDASFIKDTTLDAPLEETGVVYRREDRTRLRLSPNWAYSWDERTTLRADLGYSKVDYDNTDESGLADYDYRSGSLGSEYRWSEKTTLSAYLGYGRYERDDNLLQTDNTQLTAGFAHQFSERLTLSGSGGYRHTESKTRSAFPVCSGGTIISVAVADFLGIDTSLAQDGVLCVDPSTLSPLPFTEGGSMDSSNGYVFAGNVAYRFETGQLSLSASRDIQPNARDGLLVVDRATLQGDRKLTEKLTASLQLSWYQSQNTSDSPGQTDRELIRARPSLRWRLARDWTLTASYRYTRQRYEEISESADSNMVQASLIYRWPRIAVSR